MMVGHNNIDPNVRHVITKYVDRAKAGYLKYGTDTTRTDLGTVDWLNHLQDELMDATIYIERLKYELRSLHGIHQKDSNLS